nr:NUDIX hydrolase [Actinokineospora inagensis]
MHAAGAVLWRVDERGRIVVALVHRPRYGDWSLPKGKLDGGESTHAAAVREVAEETGWAAVLGRHLGRVDYPVPAGDKRVDYFAARAVTGAFTPNDEVDELRWLPVDEAGPVLTYPHDRVVLRQFTAAPPDTTTVLLVRHAHAGRKSLWTGPDDQRPLSALGRRQTAALTALLPLFGPDRVHAVPKERCVATVAPLAGSLGVPVLAEPLLAESAHSGHDAGHDSSRDSGPDTGLDAAVTRLREIAAAGGTPVVCSQGGVIPGVVAELTGLAEPRARKGSVWVLSFAGSKVVAADHIPPDSGD